MKTAGKTILTRFRKELDSICQANNLLYYESEINDILYELGVEMDIEEEIDLEKAKSIIKEKIRYSCREDVDILLEDCLNKFVIKYPKNEEELIDMYMNFIEEL